MVGYELMQFQEFFIFTVIIFLLLHIFKTILIATFEKHDFGNEYGLKKYLLGFITSVFSLNSFIFLVVASSITSGFFYLEFLLSKQFPFQMTMEMDQARILGFGSILLIIIPLISIFSEDMKRIKEYSSEDEISEDFFDDDENDELGDMRTTIPNDNSVDLKFIRYVHAYTKYKEKTKNPELLIKSIVNDVLYIDGNEYRNFFDKKLYFALKFKIDTIISPDQGCETIPSPDIAICQLENLGTTHTQFKIVTWLEVDEYIDEISKIKNNQEFSLLKPFIQLKEAGIGEKCTFNEMETTMKALDKMKKMLDDEGI